jgi:hypothetical protein
MLHCAARCRTNATWRALARYSEGKSAHAELVGGANGEEKDEDEEVGP